MAGGSYGILHFRLLKAFSLRLAEGAQRSTEVMGRRPSDPSKPKLCPTLRPTREQFEKPFPEYVEAVFKKHPDWPCFKVVPPKDWSPRQGDYDLSQVNIGTPIKQHVFGKAGAFMAILEEQKSMDGAAFEKMATAKANRPPRKGHSGDTMLERSFWSSITMNPPLYGADTPTSLFDEKVPWGWNLRDLGCLLKEYDVPEISGVTSPMTYFGMWKAFFGWHKEDLDLMSVNYLHKGAAKVWYCVPPSAAPKFDAMARTLFPEAAAACPSFMRHKDVVISPKVLKSFNVPYIQAKQKAGEFIVLNAAAYHAGFNLGFNCAEAVNFALPSWLDVGREFVPCECGALPEGVQLDLSIFFPGIYDDSEEESAEESESEEGSEEESEEEEEETNSRMSRKRRRGASSDSEGDVEATPPPEKRPVRVRTPKVPEAVPSSRAAAPRGSVHATWGPVAEPRPVALVDRWPDTGELFFQLVHRLGKRSSVPGALWVGQLREEDEDGLFRPTGGTKLVHLGVRYPKLVHVRTEWTPGEGRQRLGGWKLITTDKRILM